MREGALVGNKYRLVRELGAGGMGSVWLAHAETGVEPPRAFAVKLLHADFAKNPELRARFLQEWKAAAMLRHPSIVDVFEMGLSEGAGSAPYIAMELLDGIALDAAIRRLGRLPIPLALEIVSGILRAVAVAHAAGIVHRDLKPANVFLHRPGSGAIVPKVLDFGVSKVRAEEPAFALTRTGSVVGSPMYMSPEQAASDKTIDARSDVHALGVVLWECIVGKPPFEAATYNTLVVEIMTGARPKLRDAVRDAPEGVAAIVERAFARKREERFASADQMADAIDAELGKMGLSSTLDKRTAAADLFRRLDTGAPPAQSRPQLVASPPGAQPASPVADTVHVGSPTLVSQGATERAPMRWPWVGVAGSAIVFAAGFFLFVQFRSSPPTSEPMMSNSPAAPAATPQVDPAPPPEPVQPPTVVVTLPPEKDAGAAAAPRATPPRAPAKIDKPALGY